MKTRL